MEKNLTPEQIKKIREVKEKALNENLITKRDEQPHRKTDKK